VQLEVSQEGLSSVEFMGDLLYHRRNLFVCISYYTFLLFHYMFRLLLSHLQVQFLIQRTKSRNLLEKALLCQVYVRKV
jgi:hypothetical protein